MISMPTYVGYLGGIQGSESPPNPQGIIIKEWADRYDLYAVSMSELSTGPGYTCTCTYCTCISVERGKQHLLKCSNSAVHRGLLYA